MVKCQTRALFVKSGRGRAMRNWRERLNKRYIGLAGVILGGLLVIALLVWLVPHNPNAVRETGQKGKSNVKYVLVNNDNGATFNGRAYNLGKDFVTLIEQDTKRDWTTASADEADAGLANGSYDVVVMIPSDFSRRLLNLNSTNPTKAGIDYQVANYSQVTSDLKRYGTRSLPQAARYILAVSYIKQDSLSADQQKVVLKNISQKSAAIQLNYWIYIGRADYQRALSLAKNMGDNEYILHAYAKLYTETKNDDTMNGATKQKRLDNYRKQINAYIKKLGGSKNEFESN